MNSDNIEEIENNLKNAYEIFENYRPLLDCYVLDYYVQQLWNLIPKDWRDLENLQPADLVQLLDYNKENLEGNIWPHSLKDLKEQLKKLSMRRHLLPDQDEFTPELDEIYFEAITNNWKHVKEKKRHEISLMAQFCDGTAQECDCSYIVDVGAGLGHLSRLLCVLRDNYKICAIDADPVLSDNAKVMDCGLAHTRVVHVCIEIGKDMTALEFLTIVKLALKPKESSDNFRFGIVGLHSCGNLAPTLLRLYRECNNAKFIAVVNCCYMKAPESFPVSNFCKGINSHLSYLSKELACHAIEQYIKRLRGGEMWKLKVHAYRALLEKFIVFIDPSHCHGYIANTKVTPDLSFQEYCHKAMRHSLLEIPDEMLAFSVDLQEWKKVAIFYSLKLLFAPLIETIILQDRILFIAEAGFNCRILPLFDPVKSPRNHVLISKKPM